MARALRIEYAGAWYHVMKRGAGRRQIFPNTELREMFLQLLKDIYKPTNQMAREQRAIVMLLARQYGGFTLRTLAEAFEIKRYTLVASAFCRCRSTAATDHGLAAKLDTVKRLILNMRNA